MIDYLSVSLARSSSPRPRFPPRWAPPSRGACGVIPEGEERAARLLDNARYLWRGLCELGLETSAPSSGRERSGRQRGSTPVVPVLVGEDWQAVRFWKALFDAGVYTNVAIHPAVPPTGRCCGLR